MEFYISIFPCFSVPEEEIQIFQQMHNQMIGKQIGLAILHGL